MIHDTKFIHGVVVPLVTPIDQDERFRPDALGRMVNHVIKGGVHGILCLGSSGEFWAFDMEESERILASMLEHVAGRIPVYFGIGAITTRQCTALAKIAEKHGAQAITLLPPMFLSPSDDELFDHFRAVSEATELPVLIYNNPDRMNVNVSATLVERLASLGGIAGIKDSSGDLALSIEYMRRTQKMDFKVMAGRDHLILPTLVVGGVGCVASTANIVPGLVAEIYDNFEAGDLEAARAAQIRLAPLRVAFNLASFPAVIKDALNLMGMDVGPIARPNTGCSKANMAKLKLILQETGAL